MDQLTINYEVYFYCEILHVLSYGVIYGEKQQHKR